MASAAGKGEDVVVAVPGSASAVRAASSELSAAKVRELVTVESDVLDSYTPDGFTAAVQSAIAELSPAAVVFPHTYQTRDFAPKLAARLDRALIADVTAIKQAGDRLVFVRPMFQGKLSADVMPAGPSPHLVTFQVGAYRPEQVERGDTPAPIRALAVDIDPASVRQKPEPPFREARQAVDLSQAERIVSVGRGIEEQSNL
jgi:electron transfer flavoprotein alpha subunit